MSLYDPPELRTERLRLAPIGADDASAAREIFVDDTRVTRLVAWKSLASEEAARRFVEREARAWRDAEDCRGWFAREAETGQVLGSAIARLHGEAAELS